METTKVKYKGVSIHTNSEYSEMKFKGVTYRTKERFNNPSYLINVIQDGETGNFVEVIEPEVKPKVKPENK